MTFTDFELDLIARAFAYVDSELEDMDTKPQGFDKARYYSAFASARKKAEYGETQTPFTYDEIAVVKKSLDMYVNISQPWVDRTPIKFEKEAHELHSKLEHME